VGQIPSNEVPNYIEAVARGMKKKRFFDPATGDVNERWNPLIQEDDFWLPVRPDGSGPDVTMLRGGQNLDQIADIEYFKKKMIAGLKIPFSRVGIGDQKDENKSLAQTSPEFAKAVQWIQREALVGFKKIVAVHLALRGFTEDDIKSFDLYMTASSAIDELYRIETWNSRAECIKLLKDTALFPDRWILRRFTDMTDDEIDEMEKEKELKLISAAQAEDKTKLEGYDRLLENRLQQLISDGKFMTRKESDAPESNWNYLVNNNELDGLAKDEKNEKLLIESVIPEEERIEAKTLAEELIKIQYPGRVLD